MITSHFIGIFLKSIKLKRLFFQLQKYINENDLHSVLELIRQDSFHITLYYLDGILDKKEEAMIQDLIQKIKKNNLELFTLNNLEFFMKEDQHLVGYLSVEEMKGNLKNLNTQIKEKLSHEFIDDNKFDFIPHCTIFRVKDNSVFLQHKKILLDIVNENIKDVEIFSSENLHLMAVDSTFAPESYKRVFS